MTAMTFEEEWASPELPPAFARAIDNAILESSEGEAAIFLKKQIEEWQKIAMRPDAAGYVEAALRYFRGRLDETRQRLRDTVDLAKIRIALANGALALTD